MRNHTSDCDTCKAEYMPGSFSNHLCKLDMYFTPIQDHYKIYKPCDGVADGIDDQSYGIFINTFFKNGVMAGIYKAVFLVFHRY